MNDSESIDMTIASLEQAVASQSRTLADIMTSLADKYVMAGAWQKAHDTASKSFGLCGDYTRLLNLAKTAVECAANLGGERESQCIKLLIDILAHNSQDPQILFLYADFLHRMGARARALKFFDAAISILRDRGVKVDAAQLANLANSKYALSITSERTRANPHILFATLNYSGASAVEPILRDLLTEYFGYDAFGTNHLSPYLHFYNDGPVPLYHWTHDGPSILARMTNCPRPVRCLFLYRDPRDVLLSKTKDFVHVRAYDDMPERDVMLKLMETFPQELTDARQWLEQDSGLVFTFRFDEMKRDIAAIVRKCAAFCGLELDAALLQPLVQKYSFEAMTGRRRGDEGATVRSSKHLIRKGVSGGWKTAFDADMIARFKQSCGEHLIALGFEKDLDW